MFWVAVLSQALAEVPAEPWRQHEVACYRREDAGAYAAGGDACRHVSETVPEGPAEFDQRLWSVAAVLLRALERALVAVGEGTAEALTLVTGRGGVGGRGGDGAVFWDTL